MTSCSRQLFERKTGFKHVIKQSPEKIKCVSCIHRKTPLRNNPCFTCIFRNGFPNYEEDVRITNLKIESFCKIGCDD